MYKEIAINVNNEISQINQGGNRLEAKYDPIQSKVLIEEHLEESQDSASPRKVSVRKTIDPYELRIKCRCAGCIDEVDGRQILQINKVPKDVYPTNM